LAGCRKGIKLLNAPLCHGLAEPLVESLESLAGGQEDSLDFATKEEVLRVVHEQLKPSTSCQQACIPDAFPVIILASGRHSLLG
jgi:hypothetical protein